MSKSTLKLLTALVIAITAALVTQPVRAGAIDTLVITENSSTSLTATLNNNPLSVTFNSADNWTFALVGISVKQQFWTEPDAAGEVNFVRGQDPSDSGTGTVINVLSDAATNFVGLADGTPETTIFTLNGGLLSVTFFDLAAASEAPDTGTTFSLFGLSLMGLAFLRRKLC